MTFQIAGMTDPTIEVPPGAQVSVRFINGDSDMAHMWLLARSVPAAGASSAAFTAPAPGTYHYYCAFPGHAMQGVQGRLVVERS
jgi:plastocyanin